MDGLGRLALAGGGVGGVSLVMGNARAVKWRPRWGVPVWGVRRRGARASPEGV